MKPYIDAFPGHGPRLNRAETPLQSSGKAYALALIDPLQTEPHEKSLRVGRQQLENLVYHLNIIPHNDTVDGAHRLYKMAVTKEGFTRGRRRGEVRWTLRIQLFCLCSRLCGGLVVCRLPVQDLTICLCKHVAAFLLCRRIQARRSAVCAEAACRQKLALWPSAPRGSLLLACTAMPRAQLLCPHGGLGLAWAALHGAHEVAPPKDADLAGEVAPVVRLPRQECLRSPGHTVSPWETTPTHGVPAPCRLQAHASTSSPARPTSRSC